MDFVSDNAGCFWNKPFPVNGCIIDFGGFTTYVAAEVICSYPDVVLDAEDPPMLCATRGPCASRSPSSVAVMMVGTTEEEYQDADGDAGSGHVRLAKPPQERGTARDGDPQPSQPRRRPDPLSGLVAKLTVHVAAEADTQATLAELEEQRRLLLAEA